MNETYGARRVFGPGLRRLPLAALGVVAVVASGCLSGGGSSGSAGSTPRTSEVDAFVDYWVDGSEWCAKNVECGAQTTQAECLATWPSKARTRAAVELSKLDAGGLARCERAAKAYDRCFFELPCDEETPAQLGCEAESERFDIDCAALIAALDSEPEPEPAPEPQSPSGSTSSTTLPTGLGSVLCDKSEECDGVMLSASERQQCEATVDELFGMLIPDPAAASRCLLDAACAEYETDGESVVRGCVDVDPARTYCDGDSAVHLCNSTGTCRDVSCQEGCDFIGAEAVGCAFDTNDGYDKCQCAL